MSATAAKITNSININTANVKANGIEKIVKNISGVDITSFQPIINAGWDTDDDCMLIALPTSKDNIIIGVTVTPVKNNTVPLCKYVSSGLMLNVNTSAYSANDFIYAKTDGSFTNDPTIDVDNTIAQEIGVVIRSHATLGEVYIGNVASHVQSTAKTNLSLSISDIAGLQDALNGKADLPVTTIRGSDANDYIFNGTNWVVV